VRRDQLRKHDDEVEAPAQNVATFVDDLPPRAQAAASMQRDR
jgi:hypothetical protein